MGHFRIILFVTLLHVERPLSQVTSPYETRPRLLIHEGNMHFQSGRDRNITFSTDGRSSIFFGSLDLKTLPSLGTISLYQQQLTSIEASSSSVREILTRTAGSLMRHDNSLRSLLSQVNALKINTRSKEEIRGLKRQIKKAIKDVSDLKTLATTDHCSSRPCQNGAKCLSLVGKFVCLCTDQFSGTTCSEDIDECELYEGTSTGCQNGATCVNIRGGFSCQCPSGFYGYRCTEKSASCNASSHALCGIHGICIPFTDHSPGSPGYKCLCDPGFQVVQSSTNPQCQDIDECTSSHACFPGVTCTNIDGGFRCGSCPTGYNGNGHHCFDVDECATNNGGCSTNPLVPCINTYGSFKCGSCPAGFVGDGTTCTSSTSTMCATSPCHPLATCSEMPDSITGFRCQCPRTMTGNGIGAAGCRSEFITSCTPGYCQNNGLCMMEANRPLCICGMSYTGDRCETFIGACSSKPCQNGGSCVPLRPRGYTCICRPGTEGRNCQTSLSGCDRSFTQDSGTFKYPDGVRYKSLSVCTFKFTGAVGKVLNVTFPEFDLENSTRPGCPYDNLTLWDGGDEATGSKIGTFCSCKGCPKGPDKFILTSTNKLTMKFRADGTINARGFTMNWNSVSSTCGGRISGDTGRIVSPNFPSSYGPDLHCQWIISTHPGKHYKINIGSITLRDQQANCSKDMLQIRDGERIDSPILYQRCVSGSGLSSDQTIFSSMPYLFIYFRSSGAPTSATTGTFSISYTAVEATTSCGGELSGRSGIIQSPNYGKGPYFPNVVCIWIIDVDSGSTRFTGADEIVELIFTDFDVIGRKSSSSFNLPTTNRLPIRRNRLSFQHYYRRFVDRSMTSRTKQPCEGDFVEIRDGADEYEPLIGIFCGQTIPLPVVSSSSSMWIKFSSNGLESGKGFSVAYTAKCGKVFRGTSGKIQSPNFPNPVGAPRRCEYIIEAPETYAISINFSFADFGNPVPYNCTANYIELRSAPKEAWHNRNFCSVPIDRTFTANGGRFKIIFYSDGSMDNKGFSANFNTRNVECGGVYNQRSGIIRSPRNGDEYLHNMVCVWYIEVPTGLVVKLVFSQFTLEEHEDCQFDYVAVYESYRNENDTNGFMGRYCGERKPASVQSSGNTMVVIFRSDSSIGRSGFEASFNAVNVSQSCDRTFFDANGYIESPGYPLPVTTNMECKYNIQVKRGFKVLLTVENMTMPCNESYLEIKNGDSDFAPAVGGLLLSRLCRESRVESIKSQSNALYLRFKSEPISSMSRYIFRLKYQQIAEGCGGTLNAIIGGLSAPQFPLPSSQNVDCSWRITVAKGNIVSLRVGRFDSSIPPTVSCWAWGNRLEIRDGPYLTSPLMRRVCHIEESVGVFDSTSNELSVRYVHNSVSVSIGFFAMYSTSCNNIRLRGFYGRLESPGYPGMSHIKRNCSWRIETSLGNTLRLHFTHFDVQDKGPIPCNKTYLQFVPGQIKAVADLSMKNYTSNNIFCNLSFKPSIVYSTSNVIDIKFLAQTNVPSSHFALEWITIGCGGILTDNEGKFTVVNETGNDVKYRACEWTIKAPLGRKILLVVENFVGRGATTATNCPYTPSTAFTSSSVHIFNGQDNSTGYPILSICDFINGPNAISITSTGDAMFVSMHHAVTTVPVPGGIVFAASYKFIESGCGGILTSSSGFISSPNFPNPYPLGTECNWLIKVKTGYTVQFKFATLDIGPSVANYDCTSRFGDILGTYIELFDGQNASAPLLRRFCGSRAVLIGQAIASTENAMFVRFRTSATDSMETRTGRGFSGNYSVGCGGLLTASGDKRTLESSASHFYSDCQWKIVAQNPADHVVVHVNFLFTPAQDDNCSKLYLKIFDGPSSRDSPLRTTLCGSSSPPDLISTGDTFVVALKVPPNEAAVEHHFSLTFSSTSASCGGEFHSPSGYLSYPLYPPSYLESSYCTWSIHTAVGNRIKLFFESFRTQTSEGCSDYYLEIRESSKSGKLFGRFCGDNLPPTIVGYTSLWIRFRSGENLTPLTTQSSFYAGYKLLYGGDFDTAQGIITSPWYRDPYRTFAALPIAHLTNETDQRQLNDGIWWRIRLPDQDSYAQLTFEDLRLDDSLGNLFFDSSCSQKVARLEIYDGYCLYERSEQECTLSKTLCGVGTNFVWTSVFNTASIRLLYVEGTTYRSDFKVQWDSVPSPRDEASIISEACRGTLVASLQFQNLTSPGYPNGYADNLQCRWDIVHPRNYSIWIDVVDLSIEPHAVCQHDRLVVRQQQPDPFSGGSPFSVDRFFMPFGRTPARFCGFKKPEGIENPSIWRRNFPVTVEFVTDQSVNFSGFSLQYKLVCGAHFQLKDGTTQQLTSPNYPNAYPLSTKCVWIIGGRNGRTLSVQFDEIQLESSDGCRKDNLKVINGYEGSDPVLAKYCGSPSNKPLVTSTSNFLYIEFVSDDSGVGKGFSLTVSEKRFGCDERVLILKEQNPKATLESPNFPDEYPNSLDCSWVVQAPPGHRIQFDLDPASFDLEMTRNGSCSYDYIELHDGASMVAPLLGQFCDKTSHGSVFSTGSNMLIRFVTDESIAKKGFRAIFKIATCGGTVLLKVGTVTEISSPNYPQPYSSNNICEWKVLAPEGHFINVSFADIGLMSTPNSNCTSDYVEVVDVNATGTSFGRFCKPSDSMIKIRSTSDSLYIKFVSDPHMNTHGFKILLNASEEVCGGHLTESSGIITSPMYPAPYPNKRRCRWHIDAPPGSIIKLTVEDLHMPENEMGDCRYDGLKIHDGSYAAAPEIDTYCGTRIPNEPVYSSSDAMTIAFYSDISMNGRGFKASYVFVPDQGCGNLIQNSTKVVVQFTNKTRMYCHWKIVRPMTANSSVTLKFKNFQMHDSPKCAVARMTIFAEFMDDKQHDKTIHCGKEGNFTKTFYQPVIHVMLSVTPFPDKINESLYNVEFDVLFRKCGGILTEPGTIINPGSSMKYEDNIDCPWLIVAPKGRLIETIFRKFHIEYQLNCLYDHLSLKSGPYASSTDIKTLCGDHSMVTENKTVSATGYMYILFHSDHSRSTGGFAIDYRFLDEACGSIQQGEDGLIQSPMYPLDYSNDQFCQWEVIVNNGFRVAIVFETFDIQISDNCSKDSLLIEHWRLAKTKARVTWDLLGGPYCGYQKPEPLTSDTNHVRVTFKSDASVRANGFNMTWKALCGFSYSDESGTITSPYFPSPYKSNISCQYFVKPKLNVNNSTFYTVFQFEDFQLEDMIRGDCVDYLEITEVENNNTVAKLCGNELPETLSAKGPVLLTFASDSSSEFRGFRLNYKMSECGGQIFLNEEPGNRRAKIQTPTYPAKYQNNMECEWIISTAPDKIIDFEFTNMSIESHADCRYDFVELRDGSDVNATLMGKFCGFDLPIVRFKSTSNKLYIRFYADLSISSLLGFQGIASPTYGPRLGCGGSLNVTETQPIRLISPSGGNSTAAKARAYARQLSCEWRILAPVNKVIKMDFVRFSLEPANRMGRCYDYLEIYDGFLDTGPLLGKYCGNKSPGTIISSGDQMYLHFFTDFSIEMSGFEIAIKVQDAECGRTFMLTNAVETIRQTFTPEKPFSRCRWLVETEPGKRIEAEVTDINIVDPSNTTTCSSTYLEFLNLPKIAAVSSVKECGSVPGYRFVSVGNKMALTFVSSGRLSMPNSFTVNVQIYQDCNRTINIPLSNWGARVTSPGYPNTYPANVTCVANLRAATNKVMHLYFVNFTMEESVISPKKCQYDNLTITEPSLSAETLLCGRAIPPTYLSQGNSLDIKFVSDTSVVHEGFDISVVVSDKESCGGNLTTESGAITSPNFPSYYPMNIQCVWNLRVAKGYRLQYLVTVLDFSHSTANQLSPSDDIYPDYDSDENDVSTTNAPSRRRMCNDDSDRLEIFAGAYSATNDNLLAKYCGVGDSSDESLPITNTINGHEIALKFTTTSSDSERGTGFRMLFKQVPY